MPTIVATPGAANANAYLTVAEADAYHETRLFSSAWTDAVTAVKEAAIIQATRTIDAYVCFNGLSTTETQALRWPMGVMFGRNGVAIGGSVIPQELKNATAELARLLIISDRTAENEASSQGLSKLKAGPIELTFRDEVTFSAIPLGVQQLLVASWLCVDDVDDHLFEVL